MREIGLALVVAAALLVSACGGSGGRTPTDPGPGPGVPVALEGAWSGTISVTGQGSCTVDVDLERNQQLIVGDWRATCPGGQRGDGIVVATTTFSNQVILSALPLRTQAIFNGCGWSSVAVRTSNRMSGDWSTPQGCSTGPELRGRIELTKEP